MQTSFTLAQLEDPDIAEADSILRKCVHCGFCTATCPTYVLLGDELDSPRGRIYQIKDMLEQGKGPSPDLVKHVDRCLSCLSCMTTCPSGVDYMHLVDIAREKIAEEHPRGLSEKLLRRMLSIVLPRPGLFRMALAAGWMARPFRAIMPARIAAMLSLAPKSLPATSPVDNPQVFPALGERKMRVALLQGCAQQALAPQINEATVRLLTRLGAEVVIAPDTGCCGALVHHMGETGKARKQAGRNIRAWTKVMADGGLDAVISNASGCGTMLKDYGHLMAREQDGADGSSDASKISSIARDISEVVTMLGLPDSAATPKDMTIAYHPACSLQHGQKITDLPKKLLEGAGFTVRLPKDAHLCCGSAGTYNIMQPEIATKLRDRKNETLEALTPKAIATGNIGCMMQIASGTHVPVVHTVELLDWATGGPRPKALD